MAASAAADPGWSSSKPIWLESRADERICDSLVRPTVWFQSPVRRTGRTDLVGELTSGEEPESSQLAGAGPPLLIEMSFPRVRAF